MSRANFTRFRALGARRNYDFVVTHSAIVFGKHSSGLWGNHGGFRVGTSETADGFERPPGRFYKNLGFVCSVMDGNVRSEIAGHSAKLWQDLFGKMLKILG